MAKYKVLKSVAHSVGHSFTSLMNFDGEDYVMGHLLTRARQVGLGQLEVDLLSGTVWPEELNVGPIRKAVGRYVTWLPELVAQHETSMSYVAAAKMLVEFDLSVERPARIAPTCLESPYTALVEITDDRGKVYRAEFSDWWFPEGRAEKPGFWSAFWPRRNE